MNAPKNSITFPPSLVSYSGLNFSPMKAIFALAAIILCGCGGSSMAPSATPTPTPVQQVTVFAGDSITLFWSENGESLPISSAIDAGISGADTSTILSNFQSGTLAQKPTEVFLLAGTNDALFESNSTQTAVANIEAMINEATTAGVRRIFVGTIPPVQADICPFNLCFGGDPNPRILALNAALPQMLAKHPNVVMIDYHAALSDASGSPLPGMFKDGVHPTSAGYSKMDEVVVNSMASK